MKISQTWKLLILYAAIVVLLALFMPRQLDWSPSFSKRHDLPYGAEAIHGTLHEVFASDISTNEKPLYNLVRDTMFSRTNFIFINSDFYLDSLDLSSLYKLVGNGNDVIIAAENFNREFLDSLHINIETQFNNFIDLEELNSANAELSLIHTDSTYTFKSQWSNTYFSHQDTIPAKIYGLGQQEGYYNFIKVPFGKGHFFLHTFPYALTNYYLMQEQNREYIANVFSHLPDARPVVWDEYYKPHRNADQGSPLSVLMRYKSFRWAYWLTISGILLFIIFYAKRRQRPIPIIEPLRNESLKFTKTLGSLYYNKGNHKDIFDKKVQVFKEYIYTHYLIKDITFSEEDAEKLLRKSGQKRTLVERIFELINTYSKAEKLSDAQLKAVIKKINEFYRKVKI